MIVKPYYYKAKIVSVYDGDTFRADIDLGLDQWTMYRIFRLYGVDAPEMRGDEYEFGVKSRDWLREQILDKWVMLQTFKDQKGSYRRFIADIYLLDEDGRFDPNDPISQQMLDLGLAEPYQ